MAVHRSCFRRARGRNQTRRRRVGDLASQCRKEEQGGAHHTWKFGYSFRKVDLSSDDPNQLVPGGIAREAHGTSPPWAPKSWPCHLPRKITSTLAAPASTSARVASIVTLFTLGRFSFQRLDDSLPLAGPGNGKTQQWSSSWRDLPMPAAV
uniref:Uncharacterized protein n=1 Tax=Oryza punctata TaxID=4537 RepID=A0A0E0K957_ORYPU